jgi:hypothetical protein
MDCTEADLVRMFGSLHGRDVADRWLRDVGALTVSDVGRAEVAVHRGDAAVGVLDGESRTRGSPHPAP